MKSKIVITASAVFLIGVGLALNFLPQETAAALELGGAPGAVVLVQVLSAAFLGVGFLNWLSKENAMGGIYGRPLALANILLFGVSGISLDRAAAHASTLPSIRVAAIVFTAFALGFAWLMFFHDPVSEAEKKRLRA